MNASSQVAFEIESIHKLLAFCFNVVVFDIIMLLVIFFLFFRLSNFPPKSYNTTKPTELCNWMEFDLPNSLWLDNIVCVVNWPLAELWALSGHECSGLANKLDSTTIPFPCSKGVSSPRKDSVRGLVIRMDSLQTHHLNIDSVESQSFTNQMLFNSYALLLARSGPSRA